MMYRQQSYFPIELFADAVPNSDPLMILADYRMKNQSG